MSAADRLRALRVQVLDPTHRTRAVLDRRSTRAFGAIGAVSLLLVGGCAAEEAPPAEGAPATSCSAPEDNEASACDGTAEGHAAAAKAVVEPFGLEDLEARELVDHLDALELDDRPDFMASVRYDEVIIIGDDGEEHPLPLEDDLFYLSFAPYVESTHDCFFHSLTTCVGELQGEDVDVLITGADGEVLIEETMTTFPNGFVGVWLPRDIDAEISLTHDEGTVTAPISTHDGAPTCVTTLQLEGSGTAEAKAATARTGL
ncbi:CueP family metal-binding protein [Bogoriella caseilytica]|uniref:Uncharacterized protein n=1 Tax=Bogoriella caseilytica TaxID=56055 RepID=A0A3N2B9N7_9MICO|nr:CueP family metal-binding protein [Bogoriella caseilytica]ROR71980.1 hypothetical protein EDD31_0321 [Bogoriella caseilytica]